MREVIQGVMDVLRMSGVNRDGQAAEEGETFTLPEQGDETREDTAYAADETRGSNRADGRGADRETGRRTRRSHATQAAGRARAGGSDPAAAEQRAATARLMRGVNQLATTTFEQAMSGDEDMVALSEDALARARNPEAGDKAESQLSRHDMGREQTDESSSDESNERLLRQELNRGEATRRASADDLDSERTMRQQLATQTARASTSALEQRVATDQAAAANVALGQPDSGDEDLVDEAALAAFDEAEANRDGDGKSSTVDVARKPTVTQSTAEIVSAPAPVAAPAASAVDTLGEQTASDSMMEELMMAQRAAAGGDRVGDSDAVIRLAESAAGALEVKVKREGKDLSLRVRAEDLALRQVMVDTLPELKQELQKANLVQGHIEVAEEGIDDQMQDDHAWNDEHSTEGDNRGESMDDPKRASDSSATPETSKATGPARHDGQLHVVA